MREPLALLLLLLSISFPPAASFPPEADPATYLLLKLEEGKEGIVGAQLADGESLADLRLPQSQFGNELKIQSDYKEVQLGGAGEVPAVQPLNRKTENILDSIEAMAGGETSHQHQHLHDDFLDITKNGLEVNQKALDILDQIRDQEPDQEGRKCVKKIMMREETVYEEVMTCHHSYDERCHDSYITTYEPHQEEDCDEKFRKVCTIWYEEKAISEMVEECTTPVVSDCEESERKEDCRTVYDTICDTRQVGYEVEEDFPNCTTVNMEKCEDVTVGLQTERKCEVWPTQRCSVDRRTVNHTSPSTECRKDPRKMCAPPGCTLVQGPVSCLQKMKTVLVETPQETCELQPQKTCKFVTKLVPGLKGTQECVQVPKEVCGTSRVNPRKVKKPTLMNWCYSPDCQDNKDCPQGFLCQGGSCLRDEALCRDDTGCPDTDICEEGQCVPGCRGDSDCSASHRCLSRRCYPKSGKVLLKSIVLGPTGCSDCAFDSRVSVSLLGKRTLQQPGGVSCTSASVNIEHNSNSLTSLDTEDTLNTCYKAPLNSIVSSGRLFLEGGGSLESAEVCVEWDSSEDFVYLCRLADQAEDDEEGQKLVCEESLEDTRCN